MNEVLKVHWIGPYFLFFVRAVLPERAIEALLGGAPEVGSQVLTKNSCRGRFHGAEWSCIVLSDSPRRRNGSGRDWPYKSAIRTEVWRGLGDGILRVARHPLGACGEAPDQMNDMGTTSQRLCDYKTVSGRLAPFFPLSEGLTRLRESAAALSTCRRTPAAWANTGAVSC